MSARRVSPRIELVLPGDPATRTGGYIYDRHIAEGLARRGWRVNVQALDASFPQPTPAALRAARELFAGFAPNSVVIIDGLALPGLARVLETEAKRLELVALVHHPVALETGLAPAAAERLRGDERAALSFVRRVIVTSQWTARALGEYGVPIAALRVAEPGISVSGTGRPAPLYDPPEPHGARPPRRDAVQLLCVGTLTPRKGHAVLIEALGDLRDRRWHLSCAGSLTRDPATAAAVQSQIERLRLAPRVSLLGELDTQGLERYYSRADLFVLPSYLEGYGMALADAVAHGLPVVSTTAGAIPETVPASAGMLVPPGDSRALGKALARLIDEPEALRALAASADAARDGLPTWQAAVDKFAAALDGLGSEPS
jgi:glycosyltransferase involved in cell wall biosynthesis